MMRMKELEGTWGSIWALALSGFTGVFKSVIMWLALAAAGIIIAVPVTMIVFLSMFFPDEVLELYFNADFFATILSLLTGLPLVVVLSIVGARVTARDRMMGGLEFILSKAIPPWGYVLGRSAAPILAGFILVFVPALVMVLLLATLVSPLPDNAGEILWGALGYALLYAIGVGPLAAAVGSLVSNPRYAATIWLAAVWATTPLVPIAEELGADWWWALNPIFALGSLGSTFMGIEFVGDSVLSGWLVVLAIVVVPVVVLRLRIQEAVR